MVDFLKDLSFLILPLGLGLKRTDFFEKQIKKYSGKVKDGSEPTHVIIDESIGENKEKCLTALRTHKIILSDDIRIVGTKWLSKCFEEKRLIDDEPFRFSWTERNAIHSTEKHSNQKNASEENDFRPNKKHKADVQDVVYQPSTSNCGVSQRKKMVIDELSKLADAFAARNDSWRAYSYRNAITAISRYDKDISTFKEAFEIPGIGERMALKIMEIIESGTLKKVDEIVDKKTRVLELFCNIWGVGPTTAEGWYRQGYRSLDDLTRSAKLTKQQEIGLKFYDDFLKRIPRDEVEKIGSVIGKELENTRCGWELVGSYRRGKLSCGDVDVMVVNPGPKNPRNVLLGVVDSLRKKKYLTDDLVFLDDASDEKNHRKYMGVFRFPGEGETHRRIDIFVVPQSEYASGLMHYTGSAMYNRSIRLLASKKGMTLNEHGLFTGVIRKGSDVLNEGVLVPTATEEEIFNYLGLEYKAPEERDQ